MVRHSITHFGLLTVILRISGVLCEEVTISDWHSCDKRCGNDWTPMKPCYCNVHCAYFGNCCDDYATLCIKNITYVWTKYADHVYKFFPEPTLSAVEAADRCRQDGALLVSINTDAEYDFLAAGLLGMEKINSHVGGRDSDGDNQWRWADGSTVPRRSDNWHVWLAGQPAKQKQQDTCLVMLKRSWWHAVETIFPRYGWADYRCDLTWPNELDGFICEATQFCDPSPCKNDAKCQYVGGLQEYACLCTGSFFGKHCDYEFDNTTWTDCGVSPLSADSGIITTPHYPGQYPPHSRCQWLIQAKAGSVIVLQVDRLDLEQSKDCFSDQLTVYDGETETSSKLLEPFCTPVTGNEDFLDRVVVTSSSENVLVQFTSDLTTQGIGFTLSYRQDACGSGSGDSRCGSASDYTSHCGSISLNTKPRNEDCGWNIEVDQGEKINLTFSVFTLPLSGKSCDGGSLSIYDGDVSDAGLLMKVCGVQFPFSVVSRTNKIYLRMTSLVGVAWRENGFSLAYETLDGSTYSELRSTNTITGDSGRLNVDDTTLTTLQDGLYRSRWSIRTKPGRFLRLRWSYGNALPLEAGHVRGIKIYDGVSSEAKLLSDTKLGRGDAEDSVSATGFRLFVDIHFTKTADSNNVPFTLTIDYSSSAWDNELSGCYRPRFYSKTDHSTENHHVTATNPVYIQAAVDSYRNYDPGYAAGLYCGWHVKSEEGSRLEFSVISARIRPTDPGSCAHDGFYVYDGKDTDAEVHGPYCGETADMTEKIVSSNGEMLVVFYSENRESGRPNGAFRAKITTKEDGAVSECNVLEGRTCGWQMLTDECGVIVSPNYPSYTPPSTCVWVIWSEERHYVSFYVEKIQTPTEASGCDEYLSIQEAIMDKDQKLYHRRDLLVVCANAKFNAVTEAIETSVNGAIIEFTSPMSRLWQFEISYRIVEHRDVRLLEEHRRCDEEYFYYDGICYRLYESYEDTKHELTTWADAERICEESNATISSIRDERISYYFRYNMAHDWRWFEQVFRESIGLLFIGLTALNGTYRWKDGSPMSHTDWYKVPPMWRTESDSLLSLQSIVSSTVDQPSTDTSAQCVAMVPLLPHASFLWLRLPCDYPVTHRRNTVCEKAPHDKLDNDDPWERLPADLNAGLYVAEDERLRFRSSEKVCPRGHLMGSRNCFHLHHRPGNVAETTGPWPCDSGRHGNADDVTNRGREILTTYLTLWKHSPEDGEILIGVLGAECTLMKAHRFHRYNTSYAYRTSTEDCGDLQIDKQICFTNLHEIHHACGKNEFECENGECITVDSVCDGHVTCSDGSDEREANCGASWSRFACENGKYVSMSLYCDFLDNCGDNSDERNCVHPVCDDDEFRCESGQCIQQSQVCDFTKQCADGSDETSELCARRCQGFLCYSGTCLPLSLKDDNQADCPGQSQEDETFIKPPYLDTEQPTNQLCPSDHVTCSPYSPYCYERHHACVYDTKRKSIRGTEMMMTSCRDGDHLSKLCEHTVCPGMFHCPGSYCIPYRKLCNGEADCPYGHDERFCADYECPGLYRCRGQSFCITHDDICDGKVDCETHGDDEKYCGSEDFTCPEGCSCFGHVVDCNYAQLTDIPVLSNNIRALTIAHNNITLVSNGLDSFEWLGRLDLCYNDLVNIPDLAFAGLVNLFDLDLSHNRLEEIPELELAHLISLRTLNLRHNNLKSLSQASLHGLTQLRHLMIEGNVLEDVAMDAFEKLPMLAELNSDAYKFCCIAKQVKRCTPEPDEFSSCEDLMDNDILQICIWVLGLLAFLGNTAVVGYRTLQYRRREHVKTSPFLILNLGISDFLMGVYLLIIATADATYRGVYIVYADRWRASVMCKLAGFLSLVSSEMSVFILTLITAERFITLVMAFKVTPMSVKTASRLVMAGWVGCIILGIVPLTGIDYFAETFYGRTGVCLPFHLSNARLPGWEYSVSIFLVLNFVSFVIIFAGYVAIYVVVKKATKQMSQHSSAQRDDIAMATRLLWIVATDFCCWVPIILIGFSALGGAKIAPQAAAWIAVFVLPLNAATNPLLYTFSAISTRKKKSGDKSSMSTKSVSISMTAKPLKDSRTSVATAGTDVSDRSAVNGAAANDAEDK